MRERSQHPARRPSALRGLPAAGALTGLVAAAALGYGGVVPGPTHSLDIVRSGQQVKPQIQSLTVPAAASSQTGPTFEKPNTKEQPHALAAPHSSQQESSPAAPSSSLSPSKSGGSSASSTPSPSASSAPSGSPSPAPTPTPSPSPTPTLRQAQPQADSGPGAVASLAKTSTDDYSMLGVTWAPGSAPEDLRVQMRSRGEQGWTDWTALEVDPDGPTRTEDSSVRAGTKPAWVGTSNGVQVRALSDHGDAPADLQVDLIDPGQSTSPRLMSSVSMPRIISRSEWGADESLGDQCFSPRYGDTLKGVVVHHTVNSNDYSESESDNLVRGIYAYHTRSRGWCDVGYNFLIDRYGNIFEGRAGGVRKTVRGAHAGVSAVNEATAGISLIGRFDTGYPTRAMKDALTRLAAWKLGLFDRDPHGYAWMGGIRYPVVAGHRDIHSTECPGQHVYDWLPVLRNRIANKLAQDNSEPSAIDKKWQSLGGSESVVGDPVGKERSVSEGAMRPYAEGQIYWARKPGAHEVHDAIAARFRHEGQADGVLGFPISDVGDTTDGSAERSRFQHGIIYNSPATGAREIHGPIMNRYARTGWTTGPLGLPTTSVSPTADGNAERSRFQHGVIYNSPATGAREIHGPIMDKYGAEGWTTSDLGLPTSNVHSAGAPEAWRSNFQDGVIYYRDDTGAHEIHGRLLDRFANEGGAQGHLGLPTTDVNPTSDGAAEKSGFQHGLIYYSPETGPREIHGPIMNKYGAEGWTTSDLGLPTSNVHSAGVREASRSDFQDGVIYYRDDTGAHVVQGRVFDRFAAEGGAAGHLGLPTTDANPTSDGAAEKSGFQRGIIYSSSVTGAREIHGPILAKYAHEGWTTSDLGLPTTNVTLTSDGTAHKSRFQHGVVYYSPATGAHEIHGPIMDKYGAEGWTAGTLGLPLADVETAGAPGSTWSRFQAGAIYYRHDVGAHELYGPIFDSFAREGGARGHLGLPTTDVTRTSDGTANKSRFQHGLIYSSEATGAHEIHGPIMRRYARMGWTTSKLGLPTSNVHPVTGGLRSDFQNGWIYWDRSTGKTTVHTD